jgi:hypothetical protein
MIAKASITPTHRRLNTLEPEATVDGRGRVLVITSSVTSVATAGHTLFSARRVCKNHTAETSRSTMK